MKISIAGTILICALAVGAARATSTADVPAGPPFRVACVGDSITHGLGAAEGESYPVQLQRMLGTGWQVENFGVSGRTLLRQRDHPYWKEKAFQRAQSFAPNVVVIMLGTNDTKPQNWVHEGAFRVDYHDLIASFAELRSHPRIILCRPCPVPDPGNFGINEANLLKELPMIDQVAREEKLPEVDVHGLLESSPDLFPDHVHPNTAGAAVIAAAVYASVTGKPWAGAAAPSAPTAHAAPRVAAGLGAFARDLGPARLEKWRRRLEVLNHDISTRGLLTVSGEPDRLLTGYAYGQFYDWDLYFECVYLSYYGVSDYCFSNLRAFLRRQHADGFIPRSFGPKPFGQNQPFKPFLAQLAVLGTEQQGGDYAWMKPAFYDDLKRYMDRWFAYDHDGNGLPVWDSSDASGMDNELSRAGPKGSFFCEGTDLACYLYRELEAMAYIARRLGKTDDEIAYHAHAVALAKAVNTILWDEHDGFYYDRNERTGQLIRVKSAAGFLPLWAGIAPAARARRLVREHLTNPREFWLAYPIASYAATEPDFFEGTRGGCNWRGPNWVPVDYMVMHGLVHYGYADVARKLAARCLAMALDRNPVTREYYDSDTGKGDGMNPFWGWSSLAYVMPLDLALDYDPMAIPGSVQPWLSRDLGIAGPAPVASTGQDSPTHASVTFRGCADAELFSREVAASMQGVLRHNYVAVDSSFPVGFIRASPPPQPWYKTFWTRDGGTFLRELVKWGYFDQAKQEAHCLMTLVGRNTDGYYAFPRYFDSRRPRSGRELDGTSAVIIGLTMLYDDLPATDPMRAEIYQFLHQESSPVHFIAHELKDRPLLAGEGEFGGGMGVKGAYCNVVQNQLAALALWAYARLETEAGDPAAAGAARRDAIRLDEDIRRFLVGSDGAWIWCIDPHTLKADRAVLDTTTNRGFGGINGVLSMYADVGGFEPAQTAPSLYAVSQRTFEKLYAMPCRRRQFDRWGIWTQFDALMGGAGTSPSYGMGYAIQDLLLFDDSARAAKALHFLAADTYRPLDGYVVHRESPYYFYERMYSPEAVGKVKLEEGCSALNLVNVAEPLKVARLIVGLDDHDPAVLSLVPRLPDGWSGFQARHWPVHTVHGVAWVDFDLERGPRGTHLHLQSSRPIESLVLRLRQGERWTFLHETDVTHFERALPE